MIVGAHDPITRSVEFLDLGRGIREATVIIGVINGKTVHSQPQREKGRQQAKGHFDSDRSGSVIQAG